MNCSKCGAELTDGAVFCGNCGEAVSQTAYNTAETTPAFAAETYEAGQQPIMKMPVSASAGKKISPYNVIGLAVGTLFIIIGIVRLFFSSVSVGSTSFGADFYTYAYRGIVACAKMLGSVNTTVACLIIAVGAYIDLKALKGWLDTK